MKFCDLMTFSVVAKCMNITAAAKQLNTVQSNVTSRIHALEEHLGLPLFERHSRGVSLTRAGERFLPYAYKVLSIINEASIVARDEGEACGILTIGSMETTLASRLPETLTLFHKKYPLINIKMEAGTTADLIDKVLNSDLDGAFIAGPLDHPLILANKFCDEELILVTHPFFKSIASIKNMENNITALVLKEGCAYRQRLEQFLTSIGRPTYQRMEFGSLDGIMGCVRAGLGITLLPKSIVERSDFKEGYAMHEIDHVIANVSTLFIRRKDSYESTALKLFMNSFTMSWHRTDQHQF
ncbi:TPA: LysR family transcriptional regulator [Klebsiella quasipneumoniae subsp. similipneumoniae]|nr:LysR family transcriptional regulator [Klebsiella quasipneumoniae subsp. similipneumoniae]HCI6410002.1 LysR family transcriptional regulator [Klebsiella quasipneumoniae subsp. similipneumoniae]HCI6655260.1 LysR family transcriptional regulator [Klebsiella quasipneumoniae subsp. similipneumoniae]